MMKSIDGDYHDDVDDVDEGVDNDPILYS